MEPLAGLLVVDLTRYLPGPFASRELLQLGARIVRLQAPGGDPLAELAPAWHEVLNAGKESVELDLKADPEAGRALCSEADVVLESFRPGVAERLGRPYADFEAGVRKQASLPDGAVSLGLAGTAAPSRRDLAVVRVPSASV